MVACHKKQKAGAGNAPYAFFTEFPPIMRDVRVKRAMCHSRITGFFLAILVSLPILHSPRAAAETSGTIEQNFAGSLTAVPADNRSGKILFDRAGGLRDRKSTRLNSSHT